MTRRKKEQKKEAKNSEIISPPQSSPCVDMCLLFREKENADEDDGDECIYSFHLCFRQQNVTKPSYDI